MICLCVSPAVGDRPGAGSLSDSADSLTTVEGTNGPTHKLSSRNIFQIFTDLRSSQSQPPTGTAPGPTGGVASRDDGPLSMLVSIDTSVCCDLKGSAVCGLAVVNIFKVLGIQWAVVDSFCSL